MSSRPTNDLLQGKYKSIPFLVRKEVINSIGQKRIVHDFFGSNVRYAEADGVAPFDCTIDICFTGSTWQADYREFQAALEDASSGTLILPTFGVFTSVVAKAPASAESSHQTVGEITMTVNFTQTVETPSPSSSTVTSQDVAAQAETVMDTASDALSDSISVSSVLNNIKTLKSDMNRIFSTVSKAMEDSKTINQYINRIDNAVSSASAIVSLLFGSDSTTGILQTIEDGIDDIAVAAQIATVGNDLSASMNDILDDVIPQSNKNVIAETYADYETPDTTIATWDDDTAEREERNQNRLTIVNTFRVAGLMTMYEIASSSTYSTTTDIDNVRQTLEEYYKLIIEDDTTEVVIPTVRADIDTLKGLTDEVLNKKSQNAFSVVEIDINGFYPSTLLAYDLYGERIQTEDQLNYLADLIEGLNIEQPAHRLSGTVKVLEIK